MAKFNEEILSEEFKNDDRPKMECGMYLQSCLSKEELEKLKEDWKSSGGVKVIPWWKFAFENIMVSYNSNGN